MSDDLNVTGFFALRMASDLALAVMSMKIGPAGNPDQEAEVCIRALILELAADPRATAENILEALEIYFQLIQCIDVATSEKAEFIAEMYELLKKKTEREESGEGTPTKT